MKDITTVEMIIRILLSLVVGSIIGSERQRKNRPAGMKTHVLVCTSAALVALLQQEIAAESLQYALDFPKLAGVIRSDPARLIAQVISGIGFLGAGTIVLKEHSVVGLTTAASLWSVAGLGLAVGMGCYQLTLVGVIAIYFALTLIERIVKVPKTKKLEVHFVHRVETKEYLNRYFQRNHIDVEDIIFDADIATSVYNYVFTIELPKSMSYSDVINDLSVYSNITQIRMISLA